MQSIDELKPCPFCGQSLEPISVDGMVVMHQNLPVMRHPPLGCVLSGQKIIGRSDYAAWNRRPARVAVLEEVLTSISSNEIAEAKDALDTIQATLLHRQQPQDATFHRGLKALGDAEWKIRAALTSKER